jgi:hypothetical protein
MDDLARTNSPVNFQIPEEPAIVRRCPLSHAIVWDGAYGINGEHLHSSKGSC